MRPILLLATLASMALLALVAWCDGARVASSLFAGAEGAAQGLSDPSLPHPVQCAQPPRRGDVRRADLRRAAARRAGVAEIPVVASPRDEDAHAISFRVISRGEPLLGATLTLERPADRGRSAMEVVTDSRGRARFDRVAAGEWRLVVTSAGHAAAEMNLDVVADRSDWEPWLRRRLPTIELVPVDSTLTGFVLLANGNAAASTLVCIDDRPTTAAADLMGSKRGHGRAPRSSPPWTITDEQGCFTLDRPRDGSAFALLVCSGRTDAPLVARRELTPAERAGPAPVRVVLSDAAPFLFRMADSGGVPGRGQLILASGVFLHDLRRDPVLSRVPGIERWDVTVREPGRVELPLAAGGYKGAFRGAAGGLEAFYLVVDPDGPRVHRLVLDT